MATKLTDEHTGYTSGSGTVSASSTFGAGHESWRAFDKKTAGTNVSWNSVSGNSTTVEWIQYEFTTDVIIDSFRYSTPMKGDGTVATTRAPKNFKIETSTDGVTWIETNNVVDAPNIDTAGQWSEYYTIGNTTKMRFIRITITLNYGDTYKGFGEIEIIYSTSTLSSDNIDPLGDGSCTHLFTFDNTLDDSVGSLPATTLSSFVEFDGRQTIFVELSNNNGYSVTLPNIGTEMIGVSEYTISMLVSKLYLINGVGALVNAGTSTHSSPYYLVKLAFTSSSDLNFSMTAHENQVIVGFDSSEDRLYHIVMTFKNSVQYLYIDGILISSSPTNSVMPSTAKGNLSLGALENAAINNSSHKYANVRTFNRGVTQEEVQTIMNIDINGAPVEPLTPDDLDPFKDGTCTHVFPFQGDFEDKIAGGSITATNILANDDIVFGGGAIIDTGSSNNFNDAVIQDATIMSCSWWFDTTKSGFGGSAIRNGTSSTKYSGIFGNDYYINYYPSTVSNTKNGLVHIVIIADSTNGARLYVNGVLRATEPSAIFGRLDLNHIGYNAAGANQNFGHMMMFNRPLTQSEVTKLYNMTEASVNEKFDWMGNLVQDIQWNDLVNNEVVSLNWNGVDVWSRTAPIRDLLTTAATHTGIHFPATEVTKQTLTDESTSGLNDYYNTVTMKFQHNKITYIFSSSNSGQTISEWYLNQDTLLFESPVSEVTHNFEWFFEPLHLTTDFALVKDETDCVTGQIVSEGNAHSGPVYDTSVDATVDANTIVVTRKEQWYNSSSPGAQSGCTWTSPTTIPIAYTILV